MAQHHKLFGLMLARGLKALGPLPVLNVHTVHDLAIAVGFADFTLHIAAAVWFCLWPSHDLVSRPNSSRT